MMKITIELSPEAEARLLEEAEAQGRAPEELATRTVETVYADARAAPRPQRKMRPGSLAAELQVVLGDDYPGPGGDSRLSEIEAPCDPR